MADPMNLKPMIFGSNVIETRSSDTKTTAAAGFQLSDAQRQSLISAGVDPSQVPANVTSTQEACFADVLGDVRVAEIKSGAVPSSIEFLKAKSCL